MKLTVGNILDINDSPGTFAALAQIRNFKARRIAKALQPELATAAQSRFDLFTDENSVQTGPQSRQCKPECMAALLQAQVELRAIEIDLNADPLAASDLDGAALSLADEVTLGPIIQG